jgi:AAA family ATP:ADP antiporter
MLYPNGADNLEFMGEFAFTTGLFTCTRLVLGTSNIIRRFGWTKAALITPVVLLITGGLFFINVIFHQSVSDFMIALGTNPLNFIVLLGMAQNVLTKGCKYSFFDPTKEMSYIPLDEESKIKGKAAIDGVGSRLGKSGGSLINMFLIIIFGSVGAITPYVAVIMVVIIVLWIIAARFLGKEFDKISA